MAPEGHILTPYLESAIYYVHWHPLQVAEGLLGGPV